MERTFLSNLTHKNLVRFLGVWNTNGDPKSSYLVTEKMGGDLNHFLSEKTRFSEWDLIFIMKEIMCGIAYLHSKDVMHKDLQMRNILISETSAITKLFKPAFIVKLCDLGLSGTNPDQNSAIAANAPPEVIKEKKFTKEADLFMAGKIFDEMFKSVSLPESNCTKQVRKLIVMMTKENPEERGSAELAHLDLQSLLKTASKRKSESHPQLSEIKIKSGYMEEKKEVEAHPQLSEIKIEGGYMEEKIKTEKSEAVQTTNKITKTEYVIN